MTSLELQNEDNGDFKLNKNGLVIFRRKNPRVIVIPTHLDIFFPEEERPPSLPLLSIIRKDH